MLFETGHPWVTFKDPCNIRSPQGHVGTVHSSNLCTEITLNTNEEEIAVCNLGSINLPQHIDEGKINIEQLKGSVKTAIRMLDNVIDINFYPVPQAEKSNKKHRPIGIGLMGFQDALYKLGISYDSEDAVEFADRSMELISYFAIEASCELAEEKGESCKIAKVNIDDCRDLAVEFGVKSIPMLLFFNGGEVKDEVVGLVNKEAISSKLDAIA